jgi:hypothetical protein
MDEGAFDGLKGEGEPLPLEDAPGGDASLWMAHHIMKNSGVVPGWVADGNEIEKEIERLRSMPPEARSQAAIELNRKIALFNLSAPAAVHKLPFCP